MATRVKLSIKEQIDRARDGRSQGWMVRKLVERGVDINEYLFSRKKLERDGMKFSKTELLILSEILGVEITY